MKTFFPKKYVIEHFLNYIVVYRSLEVCKCKTKNEQINSMKKNHKCKMSNACILFGV